MHVQITHFPDKPKYMLYICEYKESENNLIVWATYDCKKDVLRFKRVKENTLIRYTSLLVDYCLQTKVQQKGIGLDIRI